MVSSCAKIVTSCFLKDCFALEKFLQVLSIDFGILAYLNCYSSLKIYTKIVYMVSEVKSFQFCFKRMKLNHCPFSLNMICCFFLNSDAAYGLMHSKSKLFQFNSNNAVLQFILEVWWLWYPHSRSLLSRGLLHSPFLSINLFNKYFCHTILRHY